MSPLLQQLIDALKCLPGVGPKSAQRMAFHLLERDRAGAKNLASALTEAVEHIGHCQSCRTLSETDICSICTSTSRDDSVLCVVETPADVLATPALFTSMRPGSSTVASFFRKTTKRSCAIRPSLNNDDVIYTKPVES